MPGYRNGRGSAEYNNNFADFCCRYQPRGERIGHLGADAAGFLIVYKSSRNTFRRNYARMGGDGFFLAGLGPSYQPAGCDDNLFEENDASFSPNIAFEATFSRGNRYLHNFANRCNYGFWLGFSSDCLIENNQLIGNRQAGIATENGYNFQVRENELIANGCGILLWSKHVPQFTEALPENNTSYNWLIEENIFQNNLQAVRIAADQDHGIRPLTPSGELGFPAPRPHSHTIRKNTFQKNRTGLVGTESNADPAELGIDLAGVEDTLIEDNLLYGI